MAIGVSYDSDPRKVMDILMDIGTSHPLVLQNPEPFVIFMGFGESTLDFEVRVYLADVFNGIAVRNDIRVAIFERFKDEGLPFPIRSVTCISFRKRSVVMSWRIRSASTGNAMLPKSTPSRRWSPNQCSTIQMPEMMTVASAEPKISRVAPARLHVANGLFPLSHPLHSLQEQRPTDGRSRQA
nr:mechanosensitive ion channel domain-containing protein [Marinicella sp. W31]MDC2876015.1 mechanosensitive ion channel [Marinicella sp. W31]